MIKVAIPNDIGEKVTKLAKGKKTTQEEIVTEALANFEAALKEKEL